LIRIKAKAKFDFNAQAGNQINLKRGQVYSILHNGGPGGWSKGVDPSTGICYISIHINLNPNLNYVITHIIL